MKKATYFAGIALAALLMLLPVITQVNHAVSNLPSAGQALMADGCPGPPIPPAA
jgi:hypothetical protein